jgi:hypothetical protein
MKNSPEERQNQTLDSQKKQVKEDSEIAYWSKEYDISPEDLKNKGYNIAIDDKIIQSYLQNAS